jgi:hypothetical protein
MHRPQPSRMHEKVLQLQTDTWLVHAREVALAVPSIDYVSWHGEHFVVVHHNHDYHNHSDAVSDHHSSACGGACNNKGDAVTNWVCVEIKDLHIRRVDCRKSVDAGAMSEARMRCASVDSDGVEGCTLYRLTMRYQGLSSEYVHFTWVCI